MRVTEYVKDPSATIPSTGQVLVHNFPPDRPDQRFGLNGFRVFLVELDPGEQLKRCDCRWRGIGPHLTTREQGL